MSEERVNPSKAEEILQSSRPPDTAARERARARLRARVDLEASPPRRRPVLTVVGTVAAVVVALVAVQAFLPPGWGGPHTSAAAELEQLESLSAGLSVAELSPGSYLYVRSELSGPMVYASAAGGGSYTLDVSSTSESWMEADGSGSRVTTYDDVSFASDGDRAAWKGAGSPPIPEGGQRVSESFGPGELPVYPVERLPADPDQLRRAIEDGSVIERAPGDANLLFAIGTLMAQQTLPSDVRQAMFEVAAQIPGVAVDDTSTDPLDRSAEAVSVTDDSGTTTLFFDPLDASLLAASRTHPSSVDSPATTTWQAYVASSVVNRIDQRVGA
jgi:hypothetical protein